jgi:DNA repair protein RadC
MSLRSLPLQERPRERLLRYGVDAISIAELLAILLGTGTKGKSVLSLAQEILHQFGGLQGLLDASIEELKQIKGIGEAKAIQLKAAFGIALKNKKSSSPFGQSFKTAKEIYAFVQPEIAYEKKEIFLVLLCDVRGRLIHFERVAVGTLSEVLVHPREVFYPAVRHKAHSIILAHNHPSGDPTPSEADLNLTRLLLQSSQVMGIRIDDHLIVCVDNFVSLNEKNRIPRSSSKLR